MMKLSTCLLICFWSIGAASATTSKSKVLGDYLATCKCGYSEISVAETLQVGEVKCDCPHFRLSGVKTACATLKSKTVPAQECMNSLDTVDSVAKQTAMESERNSLYENIKNEVIEN